jgi:FkbM family methyltransferase
MKNGIRQMISRPSLQPVWSALLKVCHAGMNYGGGQSVDASGEIEALHFAMESIQDYYPMVGIGSPRDITIFDVGANSGEYVEVALKEIGSRARVYAFEPQTASYQTLQAKFGYEPRVVLNKLALGSESRTHDLYFNDGHDSTASMVKGAIDARAQSETIEVTSLDAYCESERIERIDLLKIDTEGFEVDVLRGAKRMIESGRILSIQFEFGNTFLGTSYYLYDVFSLLMPHYRMYRVLRHGLTEVHEYTHDLEIYKIVNYMCIHKCFD